MLGDHRRPVSECKDHTKLGHRTYTPCSGEYYCMEQPQEKFTVKDSGERKTFDSGMVRDTEEGKVDYSRCLEGPMFERWAAHLTKAVVKYKDVAPGVSNWTLAAGEDEYVRFRKSALRHFIKWWRGEMDEDHAAAVFFNVNGACYVEERMKNADPTDSTPVPDFEC